MFSILLELLDLLINFWPHYFIPTLQPLKSGLYSYYTESLCSKTSGLIIHFSFFFDLSSVFYNLDTTLPFSAWRNLSLVFRKLFNLTICLLSLFLFFYFKKILIFCFFGWLIIPLLIFNFNFNFLLLFYWGYIVILTKKIS
jgi:hypothetical protein